MKRISIDGMDITEHVAKMYDAIVGSADWGSEFLDDETVESILVIGTAAGFTFPKGQELQDPSDPRPRAHNGTSEDWFKLSEQQKAEYGRLSREWHDRCNARWRAQMQAKVDAKLAEMRGDA